MTGKFQVPQDPYFSPDFLTFHKTSSVIPLEQDSRQYFFNWARNGLYHCLRAAKIQPDDTVLVPSYVCKVVPEAVQGFGAKVVYYRVTRQCGADFSDLESKLDSRTRALIAVHYFGFPQMAEDLRAFCNRRGLYFIEDCAHVLSSEHRGKPLGSFGDASVFSLRKFFPTFDGGKLVLNGPQGKLDLTWVVESRLYSLKAAKDLVDQWMAHSAHAIFRIPFTYLSSLARGLFSVLKSKPGSLALAVEKTNASFDLQLVNYPMSRLSSLVYAHSNVAKVVSRRRENYQLLSRELLSLAGVRFLFSDLPVGVCPWVLPVIFDGIEDACGKLREAGIPAVDWQGVRPNDLQLDAFPDADWLYRNVVFLPVHQNLTAEDLICITRVVKQVVESSALSEAFPPESSADATVEDHAEILRQGANQL